MFVRIICVRECVNVINRFIFSTKQLWVRNLLFAKYFENVVEANDTNDTISMFKYKI